MSLSKDGLLVKSHVARDLLQSAGLFRTDRLVVWEYVANGLQYVDPGVPPIVHVVLDSRRRRITVADNGRGMDWAGLANFFVMHGENLDRRLGQPGRGRFGTGKSAAFGIAERLTITTTRNGRRSKVWLSRCHIEQMGADEPVPVEVIEQEAPSCEPNGTTIEIEGIYLRSLDQRSVVHYIERHLARWPRNVTVYVNNHECEFSEPLVSEQIVCYPDDDTRPYLGNVELSVKVAKSPLDEEQRGIFIRANGNWVATTLAGSEGREMSQFIFGEVDVPRLEDDISPIPAFDMSRSMQLNPNNETVQALFAFIGRSVEKVRRGLVEAERRRRTEEETRRLAAQAAEIAQVINEDFTAFRRQVAEARARSRGTVDQYGDSFADEEGEELCPGTDVPAEPAPPLEPSPPAGDGSHRDRGKSDEQHRPHFVPGAAESELRATPARTDPTKPHGGFSVEFKAMGEREFRASYAHHERTIYVNLDHPQLAAAKGTGSVEDPVFRRLAYEVAFSEYAVALASELAARGEYIDPSDPIVDIRQTLNRLSRASAKLYS